MMAAAVAAPSSMREDVAREIMSGVRDCYDAIAPEFSASRERVWPEMARFREFVKHGDRVLDAGCGNGRAYQVLAGLAIEYVGVDASAGLLKEARRRISDLLAEFRSGSVTALPFGDREFEAALSAAVLHHVPSAAYRRQALAELYRVLKPGGTLFLTDWGMWRPRYWRIHLKAVFAKIFHGSRLDFFDLLLPWKASAVRTERYCHAFTRGEMRRLCRQAGFEVLENRYYADGAAVPPWRGKNLVTICRRPVGGQ